MLVDGEARPKSHRLAAGEEVRVELPPAEPEPADEPEPAGLRHRLGGRAPAGGGQAGRRRRPSRRRAQARHARAAHCAAAAPPAGRRTAPGIVHRLDRDTSGLLVVARSEEAFGRLQGARPPQGARARVSRARARPSALARVGESRRRSAVIAAIRRGIRSTRTTPRDAVTHFEVAELLARRRRCCG